MKVEGSSRECSSASEATGKHDPGSFRDRGSRVFHQGGEVFRALETGNLEEYLAVSRASFFVRETIEGRIVGSERVEVTPPPSPAGTTWTAVLRHERVPFVSYPYEWTFGMLRDAALLQLELLDAALGEGFILKDASAYNVQWRGAFPVFIDVPSFERRKQGAAWIGYRQFCQLFLYPLLIQAYRGAPFQPWLRGRIDGITPEEFSGLMGRSGLLRRGVFVHGWLHARASERFGAPGAARASDVTFSPQMIQTNVRGLLALVRGLRWRPRRSTWSEYTQECGYTDADRETKERFVEMAAGARRRALTWDLGSNTGAYSRIAARHSDYVLAIDGDQLALDRLHRSLVAEGTRSIQPLLVNLADPSPGMGWRCRERRPLEERGRPDLVLALALLHHLVLAANVPLDEAMEWLAGLGGELVVEFVDRDDPMVQRLLEGRPDFPDYRRDNFERIVERTYEVVAREQLTSASRVLYHLRPRSR